MPQDSEPAASGTRERGQGKQAFVIAAMVVAFIVTAALGVMRFAPNLIRSLPIVGAGSKTTNASLAGTNQATAASPGTNIPTASPVKMNLPGPDLWRGLMVGDVMLEKSKDSGLVYAVGKVRNDSDRQRFGVKVTLDLFDEEKKKVGAATDYTQWIDPGKEWRFRAMVTARDARTAKVASVSEQ